MTWTEELGLRRTRKRQPGPQSGVENAWRTLDFVFGLIKHAETKAITTLAASGVLGEMLIAFARDPVPRRGVAASVCAGLCAACIGSAGVFAAVALWPRTSRRDPVANPLFFADITPANGLTREHYVRRMRELARDGDEVIDHVAEQIWVNAAVARRKYRYANVAVASLIAGVLLLAAVVGCGLR